MSFSILYCLLSSVLYYDYTNTPPPTIFVASLTLGERGSGSIGHKDSSQKSTRIHMNGRGESF